MASLTLLKLGLLISLFVAFSRAQFDHEAGLSGGGLVMNDASFELWQAKTTEWDVHDDELEEEVGDRRELYWRRRYYISYGALSANRIPCPPRSGRSYYTPNCFKARGPVHPYSRGCSAIARCRR